MGANIAVDIARGELSEATIGFSVLANAEARAWAGGGCVWSRERACMHAYAIQPPPCPLVLDPAMPPPTYPCTPFASQVLRDIFQTPSFYITVRGRGGRGAHSAANRRVLQDVGWGWGGRRPHQVTSQPPFALHTRPHSPPTRSW